MRLLVLPASLALLSACAFSAPPLPAPAPGPDAVIAGVLAADRAFSADAEARGLGAAAAGLMMADGAGLLPGRDLAIGPSGVPRAVDASGLGAAGTRWEALRAEASADGRYAYTFGRGTARKGGGAAAHLRVVTFWKREGDAWKVAAFLVAEAAGPGEALPAGLAAWSRTPAYAGPAGDEDAQVLRADTEFAALSRAEGLQSAFTRYAAPDGVLAAGPVYGRGAISALFAGTRTTIDWQPWMSRAGGGLGYTIGQGTTRTPHEGGIRESCSKYLSVWRREPDGAWRYVVDLGNPCRTPGT